MALTAQATAFAAPAGLTCPRSQFCPRCHTPSKLSGRFGGGSGLDGGSGGAGCTGCTVEPGSTTVTEAVVRVFAACVVPVASDVVQVRDTQSMGPSPSRRCCQSALSSAYST